MARPTKAATKATKRATNATKVDVKALRAKLGASQAAFAKLVGASGGSVQNWERGKPISPKYVTKLRELQQQAATGSVQVPAPKRGRRPRNATVEAARAARPGRTPISGETPVLYANTVSTAQNANDVRLRFGFTVPGEQAARVVVDLVVPRNVIDQLSHQ